MNFNRVRKLVLIAILASSAAAVQAGTMWDESVSGDLSNNRLSPSVLSAGLGSNQVIGTIGDAGQGIDRDYFTLTVPTGSALSAIILLGNTSVSGGASFVALQAGPQITVTPTGAGVENLLGFAHYGNDQIGTDILPAIVTADKIPLSSGTYSVWVQDTGGPANYGLDFVISSASAAATARQVPATPALAQLALFALLVGQHCRARPKPQPRHTNA